ncbi:MAG: tetratricopeptide repeat protein [Planctomycetota bacterium]|jgi:tetratricopeptide (TPR) repeat protein
MTEYIPRIKNLGIGPQAKVILANAHFSNGNQTEAISECKAALHLNPRYPKAHLLLAKIYADLGNYSEAVHACYSVLKSSKQIIEAYFILVHIYMDNSQYHQALSVCREASKIDPQDFRFRLLLGELYSERQHQKAIKEFEIALKLNPQLEIAHYRLAQIFVEQGNEDRAIIEIEAALRLNPTVSRSHLLLGDLYFVRKDYSSALAQYQEASEINPQLAETYQRTGQAHFKLGHYHQAILAFRIALKINPKLAEAHCQLGDIFFKLKQHKVAILQYKAAINFNPQISGAYANIGDICAAHGHLQAAIRFYRKSLQIERKSCKNGDHFLEKGSYKEAVAIYRSALNLSHELPRKDVNAEKGIDLRVLRNDRRRQERYFYKFPADLLQTDGSSNPIETVDVSKQGLMIESVKQLEIGSIVELITTLSMDGRDQTLYGKIVRKCKHVDGQNHRFGIQLLSKGEGYQAWENCFLGLEV